MEIFFIETQQHARRFVVLHDRQQIGNIQYDIVEQGWLYCNQAGEKSPLFVSEEKAKEYVLLRFCR